MSTLAFPQRRITVLVDGSLCAAATCVATLSYASIFADQSFWVSILSVAVLGAVTGVLVALARSTAVAVLLAVCGFVLVAAAGRLDPSSGRPDPVQAVQQSLTDLTRATGRLLTFGLPLDVTPRLLVVPQLLAWTATILAVTLAVRVEAPLAPVLPLATHGVLVALLSGSPREWHRASVLGWLACAVTLGLLRGTRGRGVAGPTAITMPVGVVALTGVLLLGSGWLVGTVADRVSGRFDARQELAPPLSVDRLPSPLAALKSQLLTVPPRPLFQLAIRGPESDGLRYLRTVTLDRYDGTAWTSTGTLRVAGHTLAARQRAAASGATPVEVRVTVLESIGPLLPVVGEALAISGPDPLFGHLFYSGRDGVLARDTSVLPQITYTVTVAPSATSDQVPDGAPGAAPDVELTSLPIGVAGQLSQFTKRAAGQLSQARTPYERLRALERFLQARPYSLEAPTGHALHTLEDVLGQPATARGAFGFAEQHAAVFALLARREGFASRVAVGYRIRPGDGARVVTNADAHAWSEVFVSGHGWVVFEPTDPSRPQPLPAEQGSSVAGGAAARTGQGQDTYGEPSGGATRPASPDKGASQRPSGSLQAAGFLTLVVAIAITSVLCLLLALVAITVAKTLRRRRRKAKGSAAQRVCGAWSEAMDRLREHGVAEPYSASHQRMARLAELRLIRPLPSLDALAELATTAVYSRGPLTDDWVTTAWRLESRLAAEIARGRTWRRAVAHVDPRPLLPGRRERDPRRTPAIPTPLRGSELTFLRQGNRLRHRTLLKRRSTP